MGVPAPRPSLDTFPPLRSWQRRALVEYLRRRDEDFLAVATPGAGKTTFALRIAAELLADGTVDAITVVTPTEHLKSQWAAAAARGRHPARRRRSATPTCTRAADFHGAVVTYAQVGMAPAVHRRRTMARPTLVILDEIHHAGDSRSWGDGVEVRLRTRRTPAHAHRHAVSLRREPDPVRHLRARRRRPAPVPVRHLVRVLRRPARRRGPSGDLPGLLGGDALAHLGRRRAGRAPRASR